jgi:hypothetical protein
LTIKGIAKESHNDLVSFKEKMQRCIAGGVAQAIESLPPKLESLSSNPSTAKTNKQTKTKQNKKTKRPKTKKP